MSALLLIEGSDVDEVPLFDGTEDKCKTEGSTGSSAIIVGKRL